MRMRTLFAWMAIQSLFATTAPLHAKMRFFTMLELAEESDVVFVGKVTAVAKDTASVTIDEVLYGKLDKESVFVSPTHIQHCTGLSVNFTVGEQALVFGKKMDDSRIIVAASGHGKITLSPEKQKAELLAVKHLVTIAPLEERQKNEAMLTLARNQNERLRSESHHYIVSKISHCELRDQYKDDLVSLISDADPEIQRVGLQGIQFVQAQDAIPRIAELARCENLDVVSAASIALGQYDTQESVAALIALTKHENPQIRIRACIDIDGSRRSEAKEALKQLLHDKDPKVRAMGPRGLVCWLRRNEANDVLPRLVELLNDSNSEVRASAADYLGECRNSELIPPLVVALKQEPQDENLKCSILKALYCHYSKGDANAKDAIDKDIQLIVAALISGGPNDRFGPSFHAVGILNLSPKAEAKDALKWAVQSHPNKEIRAYAERCLSR